MTRQDPKRRSDGPDEAGILELLGFGAPATLGPLDAAPAPAPESLAPDSAFVAPPAHVPAQAHRPAAPVDSFASLVAGVAPTSTLQAAQGQAAVVPVASAVVPAAGSAPTAAAAAAPGSRRALREQERTTAPVAASARKAAPASRRSAKAAPVVVTRGSTRPARSHPTARKVGSRLLSLGAMVFAGALAVGMSVPANAFGPSNTDAAVAETSSAAKAQSQSVEVASTVTAAATGRDSYTVTSWAQMLQLKYGTRDFSYTVGTGSIRWPFPYVVPISSGFGERAAPCRACSSIHMGVDFTPGGGAPIYAIADGVVTTHDDDSGGFGNHVIIDHGNLLGDGVDIESLYAHMQHGSSPLVVGQQIKVGDFIGLVGMTGTATGNHLHLEIHQNHVPVDPFAWLKAHSN